MSDLTPLIRKYREIDESIKKINKGLTDLRDERGELELKMAEIFQQPQYQGIHKMELSDQSQIRIQRPGDYNKPWSLSKKELQTLLSEFFSSSEPKNAEDCFKYITEKRAKDLVGTEVHFTRLERM